MKWQKLDDSQIEITFDNGVKMLMIGKKPLAALVNRKDTSPVVIRTNQELDITTSHQLAEWISHQPVTSAIVAQSVLNKLLDNEGKL
jgi:hypothetical protein